MDLVEIQVDVDTTPDKEKHLRRNFEAGGTKLWGAHFDGDSDSEMSSLTPVQESDSQSLTDSLDLSPGRVESSSFNDLSYSNVGLARRRQSEFRASQLKQKQLWQKAAKQLKQGVNERRRQSIMQFDIEDITEPTWKISSASEDDDDEDSAVHHNHITSHAAGKSPEPITTDHSPPLTLHYKVQPVTSLDIERNVKPQLQPANNFIGFVFPKLPTHFTTNVNESLYQRYYSGKKKKAIMTLNVLHCLVLFFILFIKLLPIPSSTQPINTNYILIEITTTAILVICHIIVCLFIRKANSSGHVRICAYLTWAIFLLDTEVYTLTSFINYMNLQMSIKPDITWNQTGTWQTLLKLFSTLVFLSVIPFRLTIILSAVLSVFHVVTLFVLVAIDSFKCWERVIIDCIIMLAIYVVGVINNFMVERTERKAFLEIRTCIESRHTIAKENINQERLVLSVLPKFIVEDIQNRKDNETPSNFVNMYLRKYDTVSILFADICGFTTLGSQLHAKELVNMLNDLFANFDKLAKKHKCLRIKLLGDCYECVCGIPEYQKEHADNCVEMGLDMIKAIRQVRQQQKVECLDMRIGIHTGSVFCGVLGLRKWQFDIYSENVKTANAMESSGEKGRVHISETTLQCLTRPFQTEYNANLANEYLNELGLKTYFIKPPDEQHCVESREPLSSRISHLFERRITVHSIEGECLACGLNSKIPHSLRHSTDTAVNKMIERATDSQTENKLISKVVHTVLLRYKADDMEEKYRKSRDEAFQTNVLSFVLMTSTVIVMQAVSSAGLSSLSFVSPLVAGVVLFMSAISLICVILYQLIIYCKLKKDKHSAKELTSDDSLTSIDDNSVYSMIPRMFTVKNTVITVLMLTLLFSTVFIPIYNIVSKTDPKKHCYYGYTWTSCLMVMLCTITFLKWLYPIKVIVVSLMAISYIAVFEVQEWVFGRSLKGLYAEISSNLSLIQNDQNQTLMGYTYSADFTTMRSLYGHIIIYERLEYVLVLVFAAVLLIYHFRVLELHSRLDFCWRLQAKQELEEMDQLRENNLTLLRNILPEHVTQHFLGRTKKDEDLYCESYDNVAVMFAAISNFNEFWLAEPGNEHGRGCLMILNEIIADFDELLGRAAFLEVEKIKTIGGTYMTCVGLSPLQKSENDVSQNLKTCVDLAFAMQKALADINQNGFNNNFKLRIGINHGPVVAGVIGARKPHYDIWGHTVNLASRMESNGVEERVQVLEKTAKILMKIGYQCIPRAVINVKGITTPQKVYLVMMESERDRPVPHFSIKRPSIPSLVCNIMQSQKQKQKLVDLPEQ